VGGLARLFGDFEAEDLREERERRGGRGRNQLDMGELGEQRGGDGGHRSLLVARRLFGGAARGPRGLPPGAANPSRAVGVAAPPPRARRTRTGRAWRRPRTARRGTGPRRRGAAARRKRGRPRKRVQRTSASS